MLAKVHALLVAMLRGNPDLILDSCSVRAKRGGDLTGPDPSDRGKRGTKYHIATDADCVRSCCIATAANVNDTLAFQRLFLAAFAVMARIRTVFAHKGYDAEDHRKLCRSFDIEPQIHKRGSLRVSGSAQRRRLLRQARGGEARGAHSATLRAHYQLAPRAGHDSGVDLLSFFRRNGDPPPSNGRPAFHRGCGALHAALCVAEMCLPPGGFAMWSLRKKLEIPLPEQCLPGRAIRMPVPDQHYVNGHALAGPYPQGLETAVFGLGCFWGAERIFWQTPGVWTTAVGYAGGSTPNPTYEEVCSAAPGTPRPCWSCSTRRRSATTQLLKIFWESHDPTQGMRQGNDAGTQYRSAIYTFSPRAAPRRRGLARALSAAARQGRLRRDHDRDPRRRRNSTSPRIIISNIWQRTRTAIAGSAVPACPAPWVSRLGVSRWAGPRSGREPRRRALRSIA